LQVSPEVFRKQMRFLREHRYNIVTLEVVADLLKNNKRIPPKTVAITFDDGYRDNYIYAYPIIKEYKIPVTIFIIVNEVGRAQQDRLYWSEIKEMQSSGLVTFGSHALDPEPLVNLKSPLELKRQIFDSKKILEKELGTTVNSFCYAGGLFNNDIKELTKEAGYTVAASTKARGYSQKDIFALKRIRAPQSGSSFVVWLQTSGYYNSFKGGKKK
jgi:peptidoglycan/xylan/chitin deacetylase (PgdA/CDA1 family)